MNGIPDRHAQILAVHASFIHAVVQAATGAGHTPLDELLAEARQQGWHGLVAAVRRILGGERGPEVLAGLDEEDRIIAGAILAGIQDPASLPDPGAEADPRHAAPGLAHMIQLARHGDARALKALADMAEQMVAAGGDMASLGGSMRDLINGERDPEKLARGMSRRGRGLLLSVLEELQRLEAH
ncbi:MAG: hypothetical protein LJE84_07885 [Gammaproteobacteria bacterium]|jgi:hypothetical protein|nr:hypothetical protein [Gammaproteobacteria bacterium]